MEVRDEAGKQLVGPEQSKAGPQPEASKASRASKQSSLGGLAEGAGPGEQPACPA